MPVQTVSIPQKLRQEAERCAARQGMLLEQFLLSAVAERVSMLKQKLDDPAFPQIIYRSGASGQSVPVLRCTGIRVQTIAVAIRNWKLTPVQVAVEYGISESQVNEALAFYARHKGIVL